MSYLLFSQQTKIEGRKTNVWKVKNKSNGIFLGKIEWYSPFRAFTFKPERDLIFDTKCLNEIVAFINIEMQKRKKITITKPV